MALDAVDDNFERDEIFATLGDDEVRAAFTRFNELFVHGFDGRQILLDDGINRAAALFHVAPDAAAEAHVGVGVDKNADVHLIAERAAGEDQNALDDDDLPRLDVQHLARV